MKDKEYVLSELNRIKEDLLAKHGENSAQLDTIEKCIIRMEEDIRHHIKRTDTLQDMVEPIYKAFIGVKWSAAAVVTALTILGGVLRLKGLL